MPATARTITRNDPHQRSVSILGATGSIGDSTLRVLDEHADKYQVVALTAQNNAEKLIALARKYQPQMVAIGNAAHYKMVKDALPHIKVAAGAEGVKQAAALACDISIAAIVGAAGLAPTMAAIAQGNCVAIANKEALVCAGELVMRARQNYGTTLLPIDSEHNAIFQVVQQSLLPQGGRRLDEGASTLCTNLTAPSPNLSPLGGEGYAGARSLETYNSAVEKLTLTASGGPLLHRPLDTFDRVTPEEAVNHPRWSMGAKISVDSATMMNKGLELIEAHYLFAMPPAQIDVLIHPESIIHSLVHFTDGSVLAQLGMPDMAIPIAYALSWPNRLQVATPRLDLAEIARLTFSTPDHARFPALNLARAALTASPAHRIALNAANEIAVAAFLERRVIFPQIVEIVAKVLEKTSTGTISTVDDVMAVDAAARIQAERLCTVA